MKKSVLSGLITGVLTIVTAYAAPSASAEETTDESTQTYETDAIVITASRSETTISDVPADVTLISGEQIERGNYTSVSDALKGANINVVQKGFASYPVINGDSRVLVMVDGKKVNWDHLMVSGDSNAVDVDQIPIGNVERIEIVRGPNSSLYGERRLRRHQHHHETADGRNPRRHIQRTARLVGREARERQHQRRRWEEQHQGRHRTRTPQ
jgi:tonB-dependent receptor